jgi:hypothetical protein
LVGPAGDGVAARLLDVTGIELGANPEALIEVGVHGVFSSAGLHHDLAVVFALLSVDAWQELRIELALFDAGHGLTGANRQPEQQPA